MLICHCEAVNDATICQLLDGAELTTEDIAKRCGAGSQCGGCVQSIQSLVEQTRSPGAGSTPDWGLTAAG